MHRDSITPINQHFFNPSICNTDGWYDNHHGKYSDVMPAEVSPSGEVSIPYQQNITGSGALEISVPIEIPSKDNRYLPQLRLVYNSQARGISNVGIRGWQLIYGTSITRTNQVPYYDGTHRPVQMDMHDALTLGGVRLYRKPNQSNTANPIDMGTVVGDIHVRAYTQGSGENRFYSYFEAFYPNGKVCRYGYADEAGARLTYPLTWERSRQGDQLHFQYMEREAAHPLIRHIRFGRSDSIRFIYTSLPAEVQYSAGQTLRMDRFLSEILVDCSPTGSTQTNRYTGQRYRLDTLNYQNQPVLKGINRSTTSSYGNSMLSFGYGKQFDKQRTIHG